jgi:hypothetical protein
MADYHKKIVTQAELEAHNTEEDAWLRIDNTVFDITTFQNLHPGGQKIITKYAGTDASEAFYGLHRHEVLETWAPKLAVGRHEDAKDKDPSRDVITRDEISKVPYAEPMAWAGFDQPHYYKESHIAYRKAMRTWVHEEIVLSGMGEEYEANDEKPPDSIFLEMGRLGILAARLGKGAHLQVWKDQIAPKEFNGKIMGIVNVDEVS